MSPTRAAEVTSSASGSSMNRSTSVCSTLSRASFHAAASAAASSYRRAIATCTAWASTRSRADSVGDDSRARVERLSRLDRPRSLHRDPRTPQQQPGARPLAALTPADRILDDGVRDVEVADVHRDDRGDDGGKLGDRCRGRGRRVHLGRADEVGDRRLGAVGRRAWRAGRGRADPSRRRGSKAAPGARSALRRRRRPRRSRPRRSSRERASRHPTGASERYDRLAHAHHAAR